VWVAGSTHPDEEAIVLEAHRQLRAGHPRALLILAPRHPARFTATAAAIAAKGFQYSRRSGAGSQGPPDVLLLDSIGELLEFYAAADVAFVGGSLVPVGGHNLLEPAALGVPVVSGPEQFNSPDVARALAEQGALITVHDANELAAALASLIGDPDRRARKGDAARLAMDSHRGALAKLLRLTQALLSTTSRPQR
jgi:3-deoxy-D-manno-octulosonic-acid transferase